MEINIAVIPGDGIGPEITEATEQVLKRVCEIYGHVLNITHVKACSSSIEETGEPLPKRVFKKVPSGRCSSSGKYRSGKI